MGPTRILRFISAMTCGPQIPMIACIGFLSCLASGCSIQGYGTSWSRVVRTESAIVVDTYRFGAIGQVGRENTLALGFLREIDVHPLEVETEATAGRSLFWRQPFHKDDPLLDIRVLLGAATDASRVRSGFSAGFVSEARTRPIHRDESCVLQLDFDPKALDETRAEWIFVPNSIDPQGMEN